LVETAHLLLRPYAPEDLLALIEQPERFETLTGLPAAPGLREFMISPDVSPAWAASLRTLQHPDPWTLGFAVIDKESRSVIGGASFKGAPDATGIVEIAYGIVPSFEGRGYATEAARALVNYAQGNDKVRRIIAHTVPEANASTRVLGKCGFTFACEVIDPEDGRVWRWEYGQASSPDADAIQENG
jgi:ribosomal-protein-alanine N-acetyltransferase